MVYSATRLLESIIRPDEGSLAPEHARYVLSLDFTPEQHRRYAELAGKAEAGNLTEEEAAEIDDYLAANAFLSLLQSKARQSLKQHQPAA